MGTRGRSEWYASCLLVADQFRSPDQEDDADDDAVDGEDSEAVLAHAGQEPLDHAEGHDEGDDEPDRKNDPALAIHDDMRSRHGASGERALAGVDFFEEVVAGGGQHGGDGEQEAEFESGGTAEAGHLARRDCRHGARHTWEDRRERLAQTDPDGLAEAHLFNVVGGWLVAAGPDVDGPHDDAANEKRNGDDGEAAEIPVAPLFEGKRRDRRADEGEERHRDGMVEPGAVAAFTAWKGMQDLDNALKIEQQQGEDGTSLDHDGVHLPVRVFERDMHHGFADAQVGRGADRQELCQAFYNSQQNRLNVDVQKASGSES